MAERKKIAMLSGSFDPVTSGHVNLMRRAARIFDVVYVAVMVNGKKSSSGGGMFTDSERLRLLEEVCRELAEENIDNLIPALCDGLASDFAAAHGVRYIVRGARNASDFDYETSLAGIMKRFDPELETVVLPTEPSLSCISSTYVRELLRYCCPIGDAMPKSAAALAESFYQEKMRSAKEKTQMERG